MKRTTEVRQMQPIQFRQPPQSLILTEIPLPTKYQEPVWAIDILEEWERRDALLDAGAYPTQSLLLCGPSGTGKSTAARWLAKKLGLPLFVMSIASTIESYMGSTGKNVDAALKYAMETKSIVLLDEIDSISASRLAKHSDVGEIWRITNSFIQGLDSWHATPRESLLIGTTNMMDGSIDSAVSRRFELKITLSMPDNCELSRIAGIPWPIDFIVSQADCARMVLHAKRQSVMRGIDYQMALMSLITSESAAEDMPF
jgi:AAA+ superfamily predicted ATPase